MAMNQGKTQLMGKLSLGLSVGRQDLFAVGTAAGIQLFRQGRVLHSKNLYRQQSGIGRPVDGYRGYRNSRRHLYSGQQGVNAV